VHEDALAAIFRVSYGDGITRLQVPSFDDAQLAIGRAHDRAVHARLPRQLPAAADLHVGR
jgi:hypothetical protein